MTTTTSSKNLPINQTRRKILQWSTHSSRQKYSRKSFTRLLDDNFQFWSFHLMNDLRQKSKLPLAECRCFREKLKIPKQTRSLPDIFIFIEIGALHETKWFDTSMMSNDKPCSRFDVSFNVLWMKCNKSKNEFLHHKYFIWRNKII